VGKGGLIEGVDRGDILTLGGGSAIQMISLDLAPMNAYFY
jgi:hypothetical protein